MPTPNQKPVEPLTREEWDFDPVPDEELIACCYWEYARESRTIGMAAGLHWCNTRDLFMTEIYQRDPARKVEHDIAAGSIARRAKAMAFDYEAFLRHFWETDLALVDMYQTLVERVWEGARPWQQLRRELRSRLVRQAAESLVLRPLGPAAVGELERLWNRNRKELDEVRSQPRCPNDDTEDVALLAETEPVALNAAGGNAQLGNTCVAFVVDFAHFTDREILLDLARWLKVQRPPRWKRPLRLIPGSPSRGRKRIEHRVALERLGLMRLLHWYTPSELRLENPKAWRKYGRKQADFRREVVAARKCFRRLFPFLPKNEQPISLPRKGIWLPEMMAACERIERELAKR